MYCVKGESEKPCLMDALGARDLVIAPAESLIACSITVDAYADALNFYFKQGFLPLSKEDEGADTRLLYFDLEGHAPRSGCFGRTLKLARHEGKHIYNEVVCRKHLFPKWDVKVFLNRIMPYEGLWYNSMRRNL